jgi:hypothetical protein
MKREQPTLMSLLRAIVDQAPYVWLANRIDVELISERVRNYQYSQQWGSGLLDPPWVR